MPRIRIQPDGRVMAGGMEIRPSRRDWRKRRCFWRAWRDGKPVTGWCFTPSLAVAEAVRKSTAGSVGSD